MFERYDGDIREDTDYPEIKRQTLVNIVVDDSLKAYESYDLLFRLEESQSCGLAS